MSQILFAGEHEHMTLFPDNTGEGKNGEAATSVMSDGSFFYFGDFIGESDAIKKISAVVSRVSGTDSTVLITGESGTGKELIARAIHANSNRRNAPMITIDRKSVV
jgi:transcriptional regulator with PAS, ATPase and Fis domain